MTRVLRRTPLVVGAILAANLALASCDNGGADRAIGVTATGVVRGYVYFDANGSRVSDAGDVPFAGARVRLLSPVSRDTLLRTTTGIDGRFRIAGVPVGTYAIVIDSASAGDSASVIEVDSAIGTVRPDDSLSIEGIISFPLRTALQVRTLPLGTALFVTGVAFHARDTYSDTILHVVDTSGAIRATRVRPGTSAQAGDSVRIRGRIATRLGQRVLDDVAVFVVGPTLIPTAPTLTSAAANTAAAGVRDGALVRVLNALVSDTATVAGSRTMTVSDGSGALVVLLDRAADVAFRPPLPAGLYEPGRRFDLLGVLVPTGTGTWRLRPRNSLDLTLR